MKTCLKCGRRIKRKYAKLCIHCQQAETKRKKEERELTKTLRHSLERESLIDLILSKV